MNRFQRQLEVAMQAINDLQDEHRITRHELRDAIAECKRLRFMQYGTERREYHDTLVESATKSKSQIIKDAADALGFTCVDLPLVDDGNVSVMGFPKLDESIDRAIANMAKARNKWRRETDMYFDVTTWLWTCKINMRPKLALEEEYPR